MNTSPASGERKAENNNAMTAIGFGRGRRKPEPGGLIYHSDMSASIYVMGRTANYEYYIWTTYTPGVFTLSTAGTSNPPSSADIPAGAARPYFYVASERTVTASVAELSERGDNLDPSMHYMITAKVKDSTGTDQYYAISRFLDKNGNAIIRGINVTSQAETINSEYVIDANGNIIMHSTDKERMIPVESDWYQTSTTRGLKFYHSTSSSASEQNWLNYSDGVINTRTIATGASEVPTEWYYDSISHYFKYYDSNDTCYYLVYSLSSGSFSFTTDQNKATHFYIYRFKPTYVYRRLLIGGFKSGNFIIVSNSSNNAIGVTPTDVISKDLTELVNRG